MGFNHTGTKLLLFARSIGVDFENTVTLGRQGLHVDKRTLQDNLSAFGMKEVNAEEILKEKNGHADPFLTKLGAKDPQSIDASDYEGATIIHDMNLEIPDNLKRKFSVVIDGGSLEHIFNFPVAIKNCMEMVKEGGHFIGISPANNFFGHGFYQFSPELYFRVFAAENGFKMEKLFFFINEPNAIWYEVKDPNEVKERVTLANKYPSYLFILAKKISGSKSMTAFPQQSDYQHISWKNKKDDKAIQNKTSILSRIMSRINDKLYKIKIRMRISSRTTGDGKKEYFKPIDKGN